MKAKRENGQVIVEMSNEDAEGLVSLMEEVDLEESEFGCFGDDLFTTLDNIDAVVPDAVATGNTCEPVGSDLDECDKREEEV
jgi:hypothetical protein